MNYYFANITEFNLEASAVINNTTSSYAPSVQLFSIKSIILSYTVPHKTFSICKTFRGTHSSSVFTQTMNVSCFDFSSETALMELVDVCSDNLCPCYIRHL